MDYGNGKGLHKYFFSAALAGVIVAAALLPPAAPAGWLTDIRNGNALSRHEQARVGRQEAVENAVAAFEKAKAAGAEDKAPYEYYTAEEYLKLAKEELASGDKIGVALFAAESENYSFEAIEKAGGGRK